MDLQFNTASITQSTESTLSAFGASEAKSSEDASLTPRGWYKANHDRTRAIGLEDSLVFLRDILKGRKFDVRILYLSPLYVFDTQVGRFWIQACRLYTIESLK